MRTILRQSAAAKAIGNRLVATSAATTTVTAAATTAATAATTTITAAATTTAATATATTTEATFFTWASFVDGQGATIDFFRVQTVHRGLSLAVVGHFDETKTLAATGVAIHHDLGALDLTEFAEELFQRFVGRVVTEISDVQTHCHNKNPANQTRPYANFPGHEKETSVVVRQVERAKQGAANKAVEIGPQRFGRQTDYPTCSSCGR
jgi:hypothetical protein